MFTAPTGFLKSTGSFLLHEMTRQGTRCRICKSEIADARPNQKYHLGKCKQEGRRRVRGRNERKAAA